MQSYCLHFILLNIIFVQSYDVYVINISVYFIWTHVAGLLNPQVTEPCNDHLYSIGYPGWACCNCSVQSDNKKVSLAMRTCFVVPASGFSFTPTCHCVPASGSFPVFLASAMTTDMIPCPKSLCYVTILSLLLCLGHLPTLQFQPP